MNTVQPSVEVVIPTHNRPDLLALALRSVLSQDYAGELSVAIVFDRQQPDLSLASTGPIAVRVLANTRAPGLAGTRNSGIATGSADLVAFLDDDDQWLPGKLARQVERLTADPAAVLSTTAIRIDYAGTHSERLTGSSCVDHDRLLESRMAMLHSSTFLVRRQALLGELGMMDESAPSSQNEDWDLLLRASAIAPISHLDEPLVSVRWGSTSMFAAAWSERIKGAEWIVERHPDIRTSRTGYARVLGQIAFGHAALGARRDAVRMARRCLRVRWREPRGYLALAVVSGAVSAQSVQHRLHKSGHGV